MSISLHRRRRSRRPERSNRQTFDEDAIYLHDRAHLSTPCTRDKVLDVYQCDDDQLNSQWHARLEKGTFEFAPARSAFHSYHLICDFVLVDLHTYANQLLHTAHLIGVTPYSGSVMQGAEDECSILLGGPHHSVLHILMHWCCVSDHEYKLRPKQFGR